MRLAVPGASWLREGSEEWAKEEKVGSEYGSEETMKGIHLADGVHDRFAPVDRSVSIPQGLRDRKKEGKQENAPFPVFCSFAAGLILLPERRLRSNELSHSSWAYSPAHKLPAPLGTRPSRSIVGEQAESGGASCRSSSREIESATDYSYRSQLNQRSLESCQRRTPAGSSSHTCLSLSPLQPLQTHRCTPQATATKLVSFSTPSNEGEGGKAGGDDDEGS